MTHLNIQQGSNLAEQVTPLIINKLYEVALSVSEPLEGELDNAYLSGYLLVGRASLNKVKYLAGTVLLRGAGNEHNNSTGRFDDLKINVTDEYYIDFAISEVERLLISGGFSSDGVGVTISDAANATFDRVGPFTENTDITSFDEFNYFTKANTNPPSGVGDGGGLFRGCTNLKSINLSLCTAIGAFQFAGGCGIETVNAPLLTTLNGEQLFNGSGVKNIVNLGSITTIPYKMFFDCKNLQSIILPTTVTSIGGGAFSMLGYSAPSITTTISGLDNVTSYGNNCFHTRPNLVLSTSDIIKALTIGDVAFRNCANLTGELYLPHLTSLGQGSFYGCTGITKVTCLGKIDNIRLEAFRKGSSNSTLTEVYLPYECTSIENTAFANNSGLTTIKQYTTSVDNWVEGLTPTYGNVSRVTSIGGNSFSSCSSLTGGIDFTNVTSIGFTAFNGCSSLAVEVNAPNLTSLGGGAFYNSGITRVTNLGSITSIKQQSGTGYNHGCFLRCTNLTEITIPNTVTTLEAYAFASTTSLSTFNIDYSIITTIEYSVFKNIGCDLGVVNFENLTTMGNKNFHCSTMDALYLPKIVSPPNNGRYTNYVYNDGLFAGNIAEGYCTIKGILYFRDIQKFYPGTFCAIKVDKIVINNSTPPTFCNNSDKTDLEVANNSEYQKNRVFAGTNLVDASTNVIGGIYVPDAAVSTYQNNSDWSPYASFIHPMSDLNQVATKAAWDQLSAADKINTLIQEYM